MTKQEIKTAVAANIAGQGNQIDISGKMAAILNAIVDNIPDAITEFVPKVALETEQIAMGEAVTKYGLTDEIFDKMSAGEIHWLSMGAANTAKMLRVVVRERGKYILCGDVVRQTNLQISITLTDDGKFDIVVPE